MFVKVTYQHLVAMLLVVLFQRVSTSICNEDKRSSFIRENLDSTCESAISSILNQGSSALSDTIFNIGCTSTCLGAYSDWLLMQCNDTHTANIARLACLVSTNQETSRTSRCRQFFPDVANSQVFTSTTQCGQIITSNASQCIESCRSPLQTIVRSFGCCFPLIYTSSNAIESLSSKGYIDHTEKSILRTFLMSNILEDCSISPLPDSCSGVPFVTVTPSEDSKSDLSLSTTETTSVVSANSAIKIHWNGPSMMLLICYFLSAIILH